MIWSEYWRTMPWPCASAPEDDIFCTMVCSVPHSKPWVSPSFSFCSADAPGCASASRVAPSFCMTTGMRCCTTAAASAVDARMISLRLSNASMRRPNSASPRSDATSSACTVPWK